MDIKNILEEGVILFVWLLSIFIESCNVFDKD